MHGGNEKRGFFRAGGGKAAEEREQKSIRSIYSQLIEDAFAAGISEAWAFWGMTPAEVKGRLKARERAYKRNLEDMDALAWMIGHYAAFGYHDPKHYPCKANIVAKDASEPPKTMSESEIQDALTVFVLANNAAAKEKTHDNRGTENII